MVEEHDREHKEWLADQAAAKKRAAHKHPEGELPEVEEEAKKKSRREENEEEAGRNWVLW